MPTNNPTSKSFMIHIADEMKSLYNSPTSKEDKIFLLDDIYINKISAWNFTDEQLSYLNAIYDRYMKELLS